MELYSGAARQFVEDVELNRIVDKLERAWFSYTGRNAPDSEVRSWRNSLRAFKDAVRMAGMADQGVLVEYKLPMNSKRIDCIVTGRSRIGRESAAIVELKQWEKALPAEGEHVLTFIGGGNRLALHPCAQSNDYYQYLLEGHTAFYGDEAVDLYSCAYLHNYTLAKDDPLLADRFKTVLEQTPLFDSPAVEGLAKYLQERVGTGTGLDVLKRVRQSEYRPSKALMGHVSRIIKGTERYVLLDEQRIAFETIKALVDQRPKGSKAVVLVEGGPGTGKSAIALQLLADMLAQGKPAHYATGSSAFNETLWRILGPVSRPHVRYFFDYREAPPDVLDVLILDEAHRIRKDSNTWRTPKGKRTSKSQVQELLEAAKVCVFFLDSAQVVRPDEVGSPENILAEAARVGAEVRRFTLDGQFRCGGSDSYVNWLDNTLGIRRTATGLWEGDDVFDFRIVPSVEGLEEAINGKLREGFTARMTAGYCWPWSKETQQDGSLVEDVVIGDWRRPWNARPGLAGLRPGIPPSYHWAYDKNGASQVGCIYTAQGFEFDYVGVIWGHDLRYDWDKMEWVGDRAKSHDPSVRRSREKFLGNVKNTYRVLMTRGLRGCYVHFLDKDTERFVRSRMATPS